MTNRRLRCSLSIVITVVIAVVVVAALLLLILQLQEGPSDHEAAMGTVAKHRDSGIHGDTTAALRRHDGGQDRTQSSQWTSDASCRARHRATAPPRHRATVQPPRHRATASQSSSRAAMQREYAPVHGGRRTEGKKGTKRAAYRHLAPHPHVFSWRSWWWAGDRRSFDPETLVRRRRRPLANL
jgi:hypothetical protein